MIRRLAVACAILAASLPAAAQEEAPPIAWVRDLAAARAQAAKEKRPLLVYLSSAAPNAQACRKLESEGFGDPATRRFVTEKFVPCWIDATRDARFASSTLGLSDYPFPNAALFDADGAPLGRLSGFETAEAWLAALRSWSERGERLAAARARAATDPAALREVADLLAGIPDGEQAALDAYGKVPVERADASMAATMVALRARIEWKSLARSVNDEFQERIKNLDPARIEEAGNRIREAYRTLAPKVGARVDEFLKKYPEATEAADALYQKAFSMLKGGFVEEGLAAGKEFLAKYPDHRFAAGLRQWLEALEPKKR